MLAIEILIVRAKVILKIQKYRISGFVSPKVCPKFIKLEGNRLPIKPPSTIPAKTSNKQVHPFLLFIFFIHSSFVFVDITYISILPDLCIESKSKKFRPIRQRSTPLYRNRQEKICLITAIGRLSPPRNAAGIS